MTVKQTVFKLYAIRREGDRIAGGRKREGLEITADEKIDGIGRSNVDGGIAHNGIGKREYRSVGSNNRAAVAYLEIDRLVTLDGKDLNGGGKFIQFSHLNGSVDEDLYTLFLQSNLSQAADHRLVIFDQFFASGIEFRVINVIEMLRKIRSGELCDTRRANGRKRCRFRAVAQCHNANVTVLMRRAGIRKEAQIVSGRIFAILRDFPVSIHVVYLFPKQKNS